MPLQKAGGTPDDRIEHRLDIRLRAADDAQDLAGGRLLVQGRGELTIARLELFEQSHVLDGDDGLVGEGRYQLDLLLGESTDFSPRQRESPDERTLPEHRDSHDSSIARPLLDLSHLILGVG